ncbi:hypothetical protein SAMN04244553_3582 [Nocardia amikacinitolerans]|uniref:Minor tail protein n=1 Tax=Nocardia amikacinitolerans TaxID=756689 RepID=A0A285LJV9_9NOCA|nr:hypothetical protein [Nocardia amikacinitolerans]SNY83956.1 hypothetical protein SAMN04244553_3582 [Nocardia amikacinitolerans]
MDISFPAHITVTETPDLDGLPMLTADIAPANESAALPLPAGPAGPPGPRGGPRTTFRKMGEIPDAAARPNALGVEDRGKWWHRLDTNGMDVWTGAGWQHSPGAVGAQGPVAPAAVITTNTTHDPAYTVPAVRVTGTGPELTLAVTAPAGLQGPKGPAGASGAISTATDFDQSVGPTQRSTFALGAGSRKWKVQPPPNGFGLWAWYGNDFNADAQQTVEQLVAGTFVIPALPFAWRPMCWGRMAIFCQSGFQNDGELRVRIGSETGAMVASGGGIRGDGAYFATSITPAFGDSTTKPISPTSTVATVPAYTETAIVVTVERVGQSTGGSIGYQRANAWLTVWAQPVA